MARDLDTVGIDVKLTNLAGHKFPSGYPARRAFVELMVQNAVGDTLFHSGGWNAEYEVNGHNASWEPHHDVIRSEDQAQIYELVMGDVNGDRTTVLERGKSALKDNRLPPLGFSTGHPSYDTTLIANVPSSDVDFNHYGNGMEGSGTDVVHYRVPMNGYAGQINVTTRVWYQSAPPRYMTEMFTFDTPEITTFRAMYEAAGPAPVLVKEATTNDMTVAVDNVRELGVRIFPNPVADGLLRVDGISDRVRSIEVYTIGGQLVGSIVPAGRRQWQVALPQRQATYVVVFGTAAGRLVERVVAY
jgi:hypothetical protein